MSRALSLDLRQRVIAAVRDEGLSHRLAAARGSVRARGGNLLTRTV